MKRLKSPQFYRGILTGFKYTLLHPQWLNNRFHRASQSLLSRLHDVSLLDIGSGDSDLWECLEPTVNLLRLDYPITNKLYLRRPDIFGDARNLPIASNTIDVVTLFEVLEHIDRYEDAIREIARVLKPGGRLIVSVPFLYPVHDAPWDYVRLTSFGLEQLLNRNGLTPVEEYRSGHSVLTVLQLANLAMMEVARDVWKASAVGGVFLATLFYPVTVMVNILALPLTLLRWRSAAPLGHCVVAQKQP